MQSANDSSSLALLWANGPRRGKIGVENGVLEGLSIEQGEGAIDGAAYTIRSADAIRMQVRVSGRYAGLGPDPLMIHIQDDQARFTCLSRDVSARHPIHVPSYGVVITTADDPRTYAEIVGTIGKHAGSTLLRQYAAEPEASFDAAAQACRALVAPTWLGISRDMRIFELNFQTLGTTLHTIQPRLAGTPAGAGDGSTQPLGYPFMFGRGCGAAVGLQRRLEAGVYPILTGHQEDGEIDYHLTAFCTLERQPLTEANLHGTDSIVAAGNAFGQMFTAEQKQRSDALAADATGGNEQTVLYFGIAATNSGKVPRYAWLKAPMPERGGHRWEAETGFGTLESGDVYCVSTLAGRPLVQEEIAVLIAPGETLHWDFMLPHRAIPRERAAQLITQDFASRHQQARAFWDSKLARAAQIELPEPRIGEMLRAGLLHLDLITYGRQPDGPLAPCIGVYCPIGSESSPIIQFMDAMGWHDEARRAIQHFLVMQHDDGMIQNFDHYMVETGALLWTVGEHFRITRDRAWVEQIAEAVRKSADFLIAWIERNRRDDLRGRGYGMIDGKVADPPDPYHVFMLNGYAYLGLARCAEMLQESDLVYAARLATAARELRQNTRDAYFDALERSPVVPLGDGTWCPAPPPWPEGCGPSALFVAPGKCFSHGTFMARDSLLGPLYLIFQEVIDPHEQAADWLIDTHTELCCQHNVAFSQPYYSRHPWVLLKRGETNAFLQAYYHTLASQADRDTYTFWEHLYGCSPHKTHEEAWFLMQTRWMLWMEEGTRLNLLAGVPRAWLGDGKQIALREVETYFGPLTLRVDAQPGQGRIVAEVNCTASRGLETVAIRLPHPDGKRAVRATGGIYDPETESMTIAAFSVHATIELNFA